MWLLFLKIYKNPYIEEEKTTQWPKKKYKKTTNDVQQHIHIKLKTEKHETGRGVSSDFPEG